jgi:3-hydroxybutyryl-CoA dehydratase
MTIPHLTVAQAQALQPGTLLHRVELPPVTSTQLAFYCAATRVADPIHYDRDFARRFGFRDLVVNGSLRISWLTGALADLVAAPDYVAHISCAHHAPVFVGDAVSLEVQTSGAAETVEGGWELPCQVTASVAGKRVDQAEGRLFFAER